MNVQPTPILVDRTLSVRILRDLILVFVRLDILGMVLCAQVYIDVSFSATVCVIDVNLINVRICNLHLQEPIA